MTQYDSFIFSLNQRLEKLQRKQSSSKDVLWEIFYFSGEHHRRIFRFGDDERTFIIFITSLDNDRPTTHVRLNFTTKSFTFNISKESDAEFEMRLEQKKSTEEFLKTIQSYEQ